MDPRLLDYYSAELNYIRALALEFAAGHPKVARRLDMQAGEVGGPYVDRLLQGAAFMNAHSQMRIDDEFPRLMQPLLQTVYPNYVSTRRTGRGRRLFRRRFGRGSHARAETAGRRG